MAHKIDNNHREIASKLRECGYQVEDLARVGSGRPDLLVGTGNGKRWVLIEIKDGETAHVLRSQLDFFANAKGYVGLAIDFDEALRIAKDPVLFAFWNHQQRKIAAWLVRNPECKAISVKRFRAEVLGS